MLPAVVFLVRNGKHCRGGRQNPLVVLVQRIVPQLCTNHRLFRRRITPKGDSRFLSLLTRRQNLNLFKFN